MKEFSLEELARHNAATRTCPMLLSIRGVVYDITSGKQFYGPNGEGSSGVSPANAVSCAAAFVSYHPAAHPGCTSYILLLCDLQFHLTAAHFFCCQVMWH